MSIKTVITEAVMLSFRFGVVTRLIGGKQGVIKSTGTVDSTKMNIIYGTPKKYRCTLPDQAETALPYAEVIISLSINVSSKN